MDSYKLRRMSNEQLAISNEVFCFALRQNGLCLDNASIVFSGSLKIILHCRHIDLRYPKIIFNFVSLVKNNFRRLPRRAYGTARNDEQRQPENQNSKPFI